MHLYIEMIPHFLRIQYFYIKMRFFRQCNLYGINSISVSMPLYESASFSLVRATGEFATIASVIRLFLSTFLQKWPTCQQDSQEWRIWAFYAVRTFLLQKTRNGYHLNHCPVVPRSDFQSALSQRLARVLELIMHINARRSKNSVDPYEV